MHRAGDDDPWAPDALVWPLLDGDRRQPRRAVVRARSAAHLGHGQTGEEGELRRGRRYAVARRLAGLFASYAVQRPPLLADWATGRDTDGAGRPLDRRPGWQPELWRRLVGGASARPARSCGTPRRSTALRAGPQALDLPARLSLFGHTRLPVTEVELLAALGEHRDVHLWLPHPSAALWDGSLTGLAGAVPAPRRHHPPRAGHPLLASLGRDAARAAAHACAAAVRDRRRRRRPARPADDRPTAARLAAGRPRAPTPPSTRRAGRSHDRRPLVQVHACHGPARQVDVLREVLLGLLADDPTLEPRDILVMCPDIETYAPLIDGRRSGSATSVDGRPPRPPAAGAARRPGARPDQPAARRGRRSCSTSPAAGSTASEVLDLAAGRAGAAAASASPTTTSSGSPAGSREAGRPLGLRRASTASAFGAGRLRRRTPGASGLDRLLARRRDVRRRHGLARHRRCRSTTSAATSIDLAGRLAEYVDRLRHVTDRARPAPARSTDWLDALRDGVDALTAVDARRRLAGRPGRSASSAGVAADARRRRAAPSTAAARRPRAARPTASPAGRPGPTSAPARSPSARWCRCARCRTGWSACSASTTACSRAPAPSTATTCSPARPLTGERDLRSEDRQLLLDAIVRRHRDARHHLHRRQRALRPARGRPRCRSASCSTPSTAPPTGAGPRRASLVRAPAAALRRPQRRARRLGTPGAVHLRPRRAGAAPAPPPAPRPPRPPFLAEPLPPPAPPDDVALADLRAFFRDPVQGVPARPARRRPAAGRRRASATRCPSSSTASSSGRSATGCSRDLLRGIAPRRRRCRRSGGAARCRRAGSAGARPARSRDQASAARRPAALAHRRAAPRARRRRRRPRRRPAADRHRRRRLRRPAGLGRLLPARRQAPARRPGSRCSRSAPPTPTATGPRGAIGRGAARRGAHAARAARAASTDAPPTLLRDLVDAATTRAARAAAAAAQDRRTPGPRRAGTRGDDADAATAGLRVADASRFPGEDADAAHVRVWGAARRLDALLERPPRRARSCDGEPPGSARSRCGCGCRCSSASSGTAVMDALRPAAARCRPAPPCSRPAPAPARPARSARWSPATSPRASRRLDQMLVITFGRAASQELRERVRAQLVDGRAGARRPGRRSADDRAARRTCSTATDDERRGAAPAAARRAGRLRRRHHRHHPPVLPAGAELARRRRRHRRRCQLVESLDDLVAEVVDDLYLRALRPSTRRARRSSRADALAARPRGGRRPAGRAAAARAPSRAPTPAAPRRFARRRARASWSAASAGSASSATTTC